MKKEKNILYLDQFAVSNMYDAAPTSTWGQLRHVVQEKVSRGILTCPMPLEHLYETVAKTRSFVTALTMHFVNITEKRMPFILY